MAELESTWKCHRGRSRVEKHCVEPELENNQPVPFTLYRMGPKASAIEKLEVDEMVKWKDFIQLERDEPLL